MLNTSPNTGGDNDTAIKLANDEKPTQGNQYIYTAYHFNKEVVKLQIVTTASIDTTENTADLQTKAVGTDKMSKLAGKLKGYEPDWYPTVRHDGSRTTSQSAQAKVWQHTQYSAQQMPAPCARPSLRLQLKSHGLRHAQPGGRCD